MLPQLVEFVNSKGASLPDLGSEQEKEIFKLAVVDFGVESESFVREYLPKSIVKILESEPYLKKGDAKKNQSLDTWNVLGPIPYLQFYKEIKAKDFGGSGLRFFEQFGTKFLELQNLKLKLSNNDFDFFRGQVNKQTGFRMGLGRQINKKNRTIFEG